MNRRIINLLAIFIILIGGIYLSQQTEVEAMPFNGCEDCLLFSPAECSECDRICEPDEEEGCLCGAERCVDGGPNHGVIRFFPSPINDPCGCS